MSFSQREIDIWRGQAEEYALDCRNQFMKALQGGRRPLPLGQGLPASGPPPQAPGIPPGAPPDLPIDQGIPPTEVPI